MGTGKSFVQQSVVILIIIAVLGGGYTIYHFSKPMEKSDAVGTQVGIGDEKATATTSSSVPLKSRQNSSKLENTSPSNELVNTSESVPPPLSIISSSTGSILYSYITLYKDGENEAHYIRIDSGVPENVKQRINATLSEHSSCFSVFSTNELRDSLRYAYDHADSGTLPFSSEDIALMDFKSIQANLFKYGYWDEVQNQKVVYVDNDLIQIDHFYDMYCDGAYRQNGTHAYNFDTHTGAEITFPQIFTHYEKDKDRINTALVEFLKKESPREEECEITYTDIDEFVNFSFTHDGLKLYSIGYPHALQACEPTDVTIPYSYLKPYLNTDSVVKSFISR